MTRTMFVSSPETDLHMKHIRHLMDNRWFCSGHPVGSEWRLSECQTTYTVNTAIAVQRMLDDNDRVNRTAILERLSDGWVYRQKSPMPFAWYHPKYMPNHLFEGVGTTLEDMLLCAGDDFYIASKPRADWGRKTQLLARHGETLIGGVEYITELCGEQPEHGGIMVVCSKVQLTCANNQKVTIHQPLLYWGDRAHYYPLQHNGNIPPGYKLDEDRALFDRFIAEFNHQVPAGYEGMMLFKPVEDSEREHSGAYPCAYLNGTRP